MAPQLNLLDWLPALPPYLPLPRWVVKLMLEMAPVTPASQSSKFEMK